MHVRLALSLIVVVRFFSLWYVFHRQESFYGQLETLPNNSISHYMSQEEWDKHRTSAMDAGINSFRLEVAWPYMVQFIAIWLAAPSVMLRSKVWRGILRRWAKREGCDLVDNDASLETESAAKSALRYGCWFLGVAAMFYVGDLDSTTGLNKGGSRLNKEELFQIHTDYIAKKLATAISLPIAYSFDKSVADPIVAFISASGFDPSAVYVFPKLMNAGCMGVFLNPVIIIGSELVEKMDKVDEVFAVIGHELGHWQFHHMMLHLANMELMLLITFITAFLLRNFTPLYAAFGYAGGNNGCGRTMPWVLTRCSTVTFFVLSPLWALYTPLCNLFFWKTEYAADAYAGQLGYGKELCSAMVRLHEEKLMMMDPLFAATMSDHPPLLHRLDMMGC